MNQLMITYDKNRHIICVGQNRKVLFISLKPINEILVFWVDKVKIQRSVGNNLESISRKIISHITILINAFEIGFGI